MSSLDFNSTKQFLKVEWKSIDIEKCKFLFKSLFEANEFEILLLDFNNFKLFYLKNDEFYIKEKFKILNPKSESPTNILIEHLRTSFDSSSELRFLFEENDKNLKIKLTGMFAGQKNFNWLFEFTSLDSIQIRDHLIYPLMFNVSEMQHREKELIEIIKQKDKELDDYRNQGCNLTRKYLFTNNFDHRLFEDGMKNKSTNETLENPFEILQSDYLSKVGATCLEKYYKTYFKLDEKKEVEKNTQSNKEDTIFSQTKGNYEKKHKLERPLSQDEITTKKQKEQAEREERENKLKQEIEEATKKKARQEHNKKKQLMK